MDEILKLADEICDLIRNSETYKEYRRAYEAIKDNPDIMDRIKKMKKAHIDFAKAYYREGNHDFNREKYIAQEFYKLMLNKDVETYFMNEHELVSMSDKLIDALTEKIKLEIFE